MPKERKLTKQEERRMLRYPNTDVFQWENLNPKGHITADCTFRAIASAANISWEDAVTGLRDAEIRYARVDMRVLDKYLEELGWTKHKQPVMDDRTKYRVHSFVKHLTEHYPNGELGNVLCTTSRHHMICVKPVREPHGTVYKIHDHWNCQNLWVSNFWTKDQQL